MKQVRMKQVAVTNAQQGDVLLRKVDNVPQGEESHVQTDHIVLAHGESGHTHVLDYPGARSAVIQGRSFLFVPHGANFLTHEEHGQIELEPGIWEFGPVQEWDYFADMARNVQD